MAIYTILLILSSMKYVWTIQEGFKYNITIDVISRASGYGESVTLLCKFEGCCSTFAAWEIWERGSNDIKPIFTDVTKLRVSNISKYDGEIRQDGYTLIIRNLSMADLNMNYTCTYGSHRSNKKLLLEEDVFHEVSYTTDTTRKPYNDNESNLETSLGVALPVILVLVMLIMCFWYRKRCRKNARKMHKVPEQIAKNEDMASLISEPENSQDRYHGKTLSKDDVKIFCICSNNSFDKDFTRELKQILMTHGFKSENIKSNIDFLPGQTYYKIPKEILKDVVKLIIVISNEYKSDDNFSQFIEQIVNSFSNEYTFADIIPILRSETVELPRCLSNITPFSQVTDSHLKLVDGLLQCPIIQEIEKFDFPLINTSMIFQSPSQHINELFIKPDKMKCFEHYEQVVIGALSDWGIDVDKDGRLSVDMGKIQKRCKNSHICLEGIFTNRMIYVKRINFVRLYGVEQFDLKQLKLHPYMEKQVIGVFKILISKLNEAKWWWYHYRRNGLRPSGSSENSFRIIKNVLQDNEPVLIYPKFKTYESRLMTFDGYPIEESSFREKMAQAGFFYFHVADYVQCFTCGGCLCKWNDKHDPVLRHKAYFKNCHFSNKIYPKQVAESDIRGLCNDKMKTFESRNESFVQFHRQYTAQKYISKEDIQRLAFDGFYYCGIAEDIACYACDIGYTTMQYSTKISNAHKTHSPCCPHIAGKNIQTPEKPELKNIYAEKAFEPYLELEYHEHDLTYVGST